MNQVNAGDLVYAVGPGHHSPEGPTDLRIYSTVVKNVRLEGSYSESASPEVLASATRAIELNDDRPVLGFPKWTYSDYEIGINIHLSAGDALRAFAKRASSRRDEAERARDRADQEAKWAEQLAGTASSHLVPAGRPPEWGTIAAAINSYIPQGREYDQDRFALQRWLDRAGTLLLAAERKTP